MWQQIISFFAAIIAFFSSLFGITPSTVKEYKNVSYGTATLQNMDVYYPESPSDIDKDVGAFILIHGGAWSAGQKENYTSLAKGIAKEGHIAATINYRMFQQKANYLDMLEDIDNAIKKLKQHAESFDVNISKIALLGDSAGGHLSLMYSYIHLNDSEQAPAIPIAFCVGRVAPTDIFDPFYLDNITIHNISLVSHLVGKEITPATIEENRELIENAFPLVHASEQSPPTILCYGGKDPIVPISNGLAMRAKLEELNVTHRWFFYENSGHDLASKLDATINEEYLNTLKEYANTYF